ncbi:hypothetical protein ACFL04_04925 [Patescibacteria group bacterium]
MDFIILGLIFFGTGLLAIIFINYVPQTEELRQRLPNRISWAGLVLAAVIGYWLWYIFSRSDGFRTVVYIFTLLIGLLVFESIFLLIIRWIKSNLLALIIGLAAANGLVYLYLEMPTFFLRNIIIIVATLGATTLLIRLNLLRTKFLFVVAALWTIYDVLVSLYFYPRVFVPVTAPRPDLFYAPVLIGSTSLGSGDFIFLVLFALVMLRDFGRLPALVLVAAEALGLLVTGLFITSTDTIVPFLLVMVPIFFAVYYFVYLKRQKWQLSNK